MFPGERIVPVRGGRENRRVAATAGYSGTPLPKKLGIRAGARVLLDSAPDGFEVDTLGELPDGVVVHRRAGKAAYDVVVVFRADASTYRRRLDRDIARITTDGRLWVAWPKKASGVLTDLSDNVVRTEGLAAGVVDTKVCAIDETWSGLMFVRRLSDRPKHRGG
jgi:hypothetical protein